MITTIPNLKAKKLNQATQVAFQGNPFGSIGREIRLGAKNSSFKKEVVDSFSNSFQKISNKNELPVAKKPLIAADKNPGPPVIDCLGNPIPDPDMPGTVIHELGNKVIEKGPNILEKIADFIDDLLDIF